MVLTSLASSSGVRSNNSFKPKPLGSTMQLGLTVGVRAKGVSGVYGKYRDTR